MNEDKFLIRYLRGKYIIINSNSKHHQMQTLSDFLLLIYLARNFDLDATKEMLRTVSSMKGIYIMQMQYP